jgi:hypothetical protein
MLSLKMLLYQHVRKVAPPRTAAGTNGGGDFGARADDMTNGTATKA